MTHHVILKMINFHTLPSTTHTSSSPNPFIHHLIYLLIGLGNLGFEVVVLGFLLVEVFHLFGSFVETEFLFFLIHPSEKFIQYRILE